MGTVNVLTNEAMPGLVKVGKTSGLLEKRMRELYKTGVPIPFSCFYAVDVTDADFVERKQHFRSTVEAEEKMRELGFLVSGTKISSVLNGKRKKAGGFTWRLSTLSTEEILAQDTNGFIDYQPPKNSNEKKGIKLVSEKDGAEEIFESISAAGRFLETSAGNVSRSINNDSLVKGYKAKLI